jgi:hypothetical protein
MRGGGPGLRIFLFNLSSPPPSPHLKISSCFPFSLSSFLPHHALPHFPGTFKCQTLLVVSYYLHACRRIRPDSLPKPFPNATNKVQGDHRSPNSISNLSSCSSASFFIITIHSISLRTSSKIRSLPVESWTRAPNRSPPSCRLRAASIPHRF